MNIVRIFHRKQRSASARLVCALLCLLAVLLTACGEAPSAEETSTRGGGISTETEDSSMEIAIGDLVTLGRYEQDGDEENGAEPLEWIVLDTQGEEALLLSRYCLDCRPYNTPFGDVTWETSSLRQWLDGAFQETAFTDGERARILAVENPNPDNRRTGVPGGEDTEDRVFLLCETEVDAYFHAEEQRWLNGRAEATPYAVGRGVYTDDEGVAFWWTRTPGTDAYSAAFVDDQGQVYTSGAYADIDYYYGVRPAIWINVSKS